MMVGCVKEARNPGSVTQEYATALKECGFKAIWGDDASAQPGHLQEVLLHETAVSWIRHRLEQSLPKKAWEETPEKFGARLRKACAEINAELDVVNLCHDFPSRVQELVDSEGDRLKH